MIQTSSIVSLLGVQTQTAPAMGAVPSASGSIAAALQRSESPLAAAAGMEGASLFQAMLACRMLPASASGSMPVERAMSKEAEKMTADTADASLSLPFAVEEDDAHPETEAASSMTALLPFTPIVPALNAAAVPASEPATPVNEIDEISASASSMPDAIHRASAAYTEHPAPGGRLMTTAPESALKQVSAAVQEGEAATALEAQAASPKETPISLVQTAVPHEPSASPVITRDEAAPVTRASGVEQHAAQVPQTGASVGNLHETRPPESASPVKTAESIPVIAQAAKEPVAAPGAAKPASPAALAEPEAGIEQEDHARVHARAQKQAMNGLRATRPVEETPMSAEPTPEPMRGAASETEATETVPPPQMPVRNERVNEEMPEALKKLVATSEAGSVLQASAPAAVRTEAPGRAPLRMMHQASPAGEQHEDAPEELMPEEHRAIRDQKERVETPRAVKTASADHPVNVQTTHGVSSGFAQSADRAIAPAVSSEFFADRANGAGSSAAGSSAASSSESAARTVNEMQAAAGSAKPQTHEQARAAAETSPVSELRTSAKQDVPSPHAMAGVNPAETQTRSAAPAHESGGKMPAHVQEDVFEKVFKEVSSIRHTPASVDVTLTPEHLGRVTVNVGLEEGRMAARINVQTPDVKQMMEAAMPRLQEMLQSNGIALDSIAVMVNNGSSFAERRNEAPKKKTGAGDAAGASEERGIEALGTSGEAKRFGYSTVEYIM